MKEKLTIMICGLILLFISVNINKPDKKDYGIDYKAKYDSLLIYDSDISNHIRKDFGIDTNSRTQYRQIRIK